MIFWRLEAPDYDSDYDFEFINGGLEHPFGLPGINCDVCGETWSGSRILPVHCPEKLKDNKSINDGWPVSLNEFDELTQKFSLMINEEYQFRPGDSFQPSYLDIASNPTADFLWSSIGSVLVSERIKNVFKQFAKDDIEFVKVIKRNVGKNEPKLPAPIPSTGEPEDIIEEVELLEEINDVNDYFEMIIKSESKLPLFTKVNSICEKCKRENIDGESRLLLLADQIWNGQNIFFLATTLYIIITDSLKNKLEEVNPTNVKITDITKKD